MPSLHEDTMPFYIKPWAVAAFDTSNGPRINSLWLPSYSSIYKELLALKRYYHYITNNYNAKSTYLYFNLFPAMFYELYKYFTVIVSFNYQNKHPLAKSETART